MVIVLTGCASSLSRKNPVEFAESLTEAKTILKSNRAIELYQKYYDFPTHKAFAQSKVSSVAAYVSFKRTKRFAISEALKNCNELLLKRHDEITDKISCEIVNVDNEWVSTPEDTKQTLSEGDPSAYEESLAQAKLILKSNSGINKYKKYYNRSNHKAFAQSKVSSAGAYVSDKTTKQFAIESALETCNQRLLKKYSEITDKVSCEIVNVDNEWVSE